jgi:hypothetical protein
MGDAGPGRPADDRAPPHRVLLVTEQACALAVEHDEELLFGAVAVGRAIELARIDDEVDEAGAHRPGRAAQIAVGAAAVVLVPPHRLDLAQLDDPARAAGRARSGPRGERQHVEAARACDEPVCQLAGEPREAVALTDVFAFPRDAGAAQDVDDLLVLPRRRPEPFLGTELLTEDADPGCPGFGLVPGRDVRYCSSSF